VPPTPPADECSGTARLRHGADAAPVAAAAAPGYNRLCAVAPLLLGEPVMSSHTPPRDHSFACGMLVGCSPLIALFVLVFLSSLLWSFGDRRRAEESPPVVLPKIDPATAVADLLPSPPAA